MRYSLDCSLCSVQEDAIITMLYMLVEYILFTKFIPELVATKASKLSCIKGVHVNIILPSFKNSAMLSGIPLIMFAALTLTACPN